MVKAPQLAQLMRPPTAPEVGLFDRGGPLAAALWCLPKVADVTAFDRPGEIAKDPLGMLRNNLQQMSDQRVAQVRTHAYVY